ncbi:hypothetical protein TPHA_0B01320 [Tetrapisispora phaffii CBS 4417]|uniref:BRCT domain-containing protein n=1 Tax=Tetrapisispora phaffii (strain ATCC 24235 / CBS 4417 / NBRC 1672 / NRRL Y-8282 / UCD 70-5) TaxID=1071381 RepID=G8BP74_TETPH|nr:hypothetical protein TPHA_0B01320 [Tetrapisispora phaffii CBS 4417]CCE61805.1 hypothetical protein TPHA_0B01320 [Tetrapisispora phaffii CBS 4417]
MKPFHGITFCPTAIQAEEASRLISKQIIKLGGNFSKDLTKYVNVLVIGQSKNTEKYKFAVKYRADIIFINVATLNQIYQLWLSGDDVTLENHSNFEHLKGDGRLKARMMAVLQAKYSIPPLENFRVFIGRISQKLKFPDDKPATAELPKILDLEKVCTKLGVASCNSNNFIKDCRSTTSSPAVFITDNPQGARVDAARSQGLAIIHYKWLLDCLKRNAMLQFDPYYLLDNVLNSLYDDIGSNACECWDKIGDYNLMKTRNKDVDNINKDSDTGDSTIITSTMLNKFKTEGNKLWNKVISNNLSQGTNMEKNKPIIHNGIDQKIALRADTGRCFDKYKFHIHNSFSEKHQRILEKVIQQNDGTIIEDMPDSNIDETVFIIIPCDRSIEELGVSSNSNLVTEFFVERCLHYKKLLLPLDSWSKPFLLTKEFEIKPNKKLLHSENLHLNVSITGFHGVELLHLTKIFDILKPMGINYMKYLNRTTDLLIINLSSLPSIPEDHVLWKNEYSDLFIEDHKTNQEKNNKQVFRNSMKKKIEFIKEEHSIPVVTPVFLLEMFHKANEVSDAEIGQLIHLNNMNWCIMCPRGKKDDFSCTIKQKSKLNTVDSVSDLFQVKNDFTYPSIKSSKDEFLNKLKAYSPNKPSDVKINSHFLKQDPLPSKVSLEMDSTPSIKRQKLSPSKSIEPVKRLASWGKLMSDKDPVENNQLNHIKISSKDEKDDDSNSAFSYGHTQVTYGVSETSNKNVKKLTRKHMKNID